MSDSAYPTDEELPPLSPSSTRSSRSEHRSTASSTRLGLPVHSRGASASTTTTRSDDSSFGDTRDQPRPPASTAWTASSSSSSTSTSFGRPALPPPPAPLPAAYSHPAIPPTPRRKPLPAPPATSPRFVPLHAPLPPPPPTTSPSAKGKGRQIEHVPTAAEEKAAARARAQGLDELLPLSSPAARARKGVDESDGGALASPASPTGTDLPDYPASPARGCLRRSGTTAKRVVERDGEELCATEDKRALAEAEVRARVNGEARRTVEEDATASKAALARRAQQEEREREEGEGRRREREVEKRRAALPHEDDEQDDYDELPPPISPKMHGRGMLPLEDPRTATPPPPPSSTASYRLPPPPVPLPEPAYPLSSRHDHRPGRHAAADYFSQPVPPRPSFPSMHSAPLPTRHARPDLERYSTMSSSSRSQLYPGAVASSTSSERSFPLAHGPVRPAGARHVSLGPAHSFYSSGVAQVVRLCLSLSAPRPSPADSRALLADSQVARGRATARSACSSLVDFDLDRVPLARAQRRHSTAQLLPKLFHLERDDAGLVLVDAGSPAAAAAVSRTVHDGELEHEHKRRRRRARRRALVLVAGAERTLVVELARVAPTRYSAALSLSSRRTSSLGAAADEPRPGAVARLLHVDPPGRPAPPLLRRAVDLARPAAVVLLLARRRARVSTSARTARLCVARARPAAVRASAEPRRRRGVPAPGRADELRRASCGELGRIAGTRIVVCFAGAGAQPGDEPTAVEPLVFVGGGELVGALAAAGRRARSRCRGAREADEHDPEPVWAEEGRGGCGRGRVGGDAGGGGRGGEDGRAGLAVVGGAVVYRVAATPGRSVPTCEGCVEVEEVPQS